MPRAAIALRRALGDRGHLVELGPIEAMRRVEQRDFDIFVAPIQIWPESAQALSWSTGSPWNPSGYSNPAVDDALRAGDFARAEDELKRDPPFVAFCRPPRTVVLDARIKNPTLGPYDLFESLPDWEISP